MPIADLDKFYKEIGSSIRKARKDSKITQELFSQQLGLSRASIINIENGKQRPPIHILYEISFITGVDIDFFIPQNLFSSKAEKGSQEKDWKKIVGDKTTDKSTRSIVLEFISSIK